MEKFVYLLTRSSAEKAPSCQDPREKKKKQKEMISTLGLLVILVVTLAVVFWVRRSQKRLDMPSPVGIPILENLLQVDPEKPHFTFTDWSRTLGEIFCVRLCGTNLVVVNSFEAVHEVLAVRGNDLAGRPRNFRARLFTNNFRNLGFCNPCPEWRMLRRAVHKDLKMFGNGFQRLENITAGVVREMAGEVVTLGQGSRAIDVRPLLYSATMNIMCVFLVGRRYRKTDEEFLLFQEMERLGVTLIASAGKGAELDAFPWLRWLGNETYERLVRFSKLRDDLYERLKQRTLGEMGTKSERGRLGELGEVEGRRGVMKEMAEKTNGRVGGGGKMQDGGEETTGTEGKERIGGEGGERGVGAGGVGRGGNSESGVGGGKEKASRLEGARVTEERRGGAQQQGGGGGGGGGDERASRAEGAEVTEEGKGGAQQGGGGRGNGEGDDQSGSIIRTLLDIVDELGSRDGFDEEFIKGTFADLILGGTASTTNLVYAYLNIMLHHRSVYDRVKAEVYQCVGGLHPTLIGHRPCLSDRATMPYTQASILELLRYVSIAPFTVPHHALVDTTIAGYKVPRGTEVLCNLWAVLHDEGFWPDPWQFKPERFLTEDGASVVAADHPNRRRLVAFGAGPRHCIGEVFALSRIFLIVTSMLRDFDLYHDPEADPVPCDPRTYSLGIALYPQDFKLRLTPTTFYAMQTV